MVTMRDEYGKPGTVANGMGFPNGRRCGMRAVKFLVVFMGVLIVVGLTVVVVTILSRSAHVADEKPEGFGTVRVTAPAGAEIGEGTSDGRHLIVRLRLPDGAVRFQLVDLATGRALGSVDFVPERP